MLSVFTLVFVLAACGNESTAEEKLRHRFPEYYDLSTAKGLEVYVWKTSENAYSCGVLPGTNRVKTDEEIEDLAANGATIEEMKTILSSYDLPNDSITVMSCAQLNSDGAYQLDDADIQNIVNTLFNQ